MVLLSNIAHAGANDEASAKKRFEEGIAALRKDDFSAALASFEESYSLQPKAAVLYNIGMCQKAMFHFVDAKKTLDRFMQEKDKGQRESHTVDAVAALEEINQKIGKIAVESSVEGADLLVDARPVGKTGEAEPVLVDPGLHIVELEKQGYERFRTEVTVPFGKTAEVKATMIALPKEEAPKPLPMELKPAPNPSDKGCVPSNKQTKKERAFLLSSVAAFGLAASGIAAGTIYVLRWSDDWDQTDALAGNCDGNNPCLDAYTHLYDRTESDKIGIAVGYGVGGALAIAGATLFVMYRKQHHKKPNVSLGQLGIATTF
jgi:tetratricopeptide (TPR) repeat protein